MTTRRTSRQVTGPASYDQLRAAEQDARGRSLEALTYMRTKGLPLTAAARTAGTTPATVRRYAGPALQQTGRRYTVTPADRIYRRMAVMTAEGRGVLDVRSSRQASLVARHYNAMSTYLATGDTTALDRFTGKTVAGRVLATHTGDIERFYRQGELSIDDIYPNR